MIWPIVVAGGGLAGGAAACLLAQAGRPVLLLEREAAAAPKICGEFLSFEAVGYLRRIGIDPASLGGHRIAALRLIRDERVIEAPLPFEGFGLSRDILDAALLDHARARGVTVRRGSSLLHVENGGPMTFSLGNGETVRGEKLLLATGKHDVRGLRRQPVRAPEDLVGFKTHWRLDGGQRRALAGYVELIVLDDGYAGLQCVEGDLANLCLLVQRTRLPRAGGEWEALLADLLRTTPHLATRLDGALPHPARPASIYRVPYGHVHRPRATDPPGIYRLGDQFAVIPSFCGDGMSIALHSAAAAAAACLRGEPASAYHARLHRDVSRQIGRAWALYRFGRWAPGLNMAMHVLGAAPRDVMRLGAAATRVPRHALRRTELALAACGV